MAELGTSRRKHWPGADSVTRQASKRPSPATAALDRGDGMSEQQQLVLEVEQASWSRAPGVIVRGEVDINTAAKLTEALDAAIRESVGAFVVDLGDVVFLDSSGINALMRARALLGRDDRPLIVVCPPGQVRRVLDLAGIADLFALFGSREEAAGALAPAQ
jgi:anti-anti-sigma factor